ncbi:hypothetical protein LTR86_010381 [Recurvomyces mirabilis]|nr:hypothetical protein LTR86_010381 [Recurvomyces mirabilis]
MGVFQDNFEVLPQYHIFRCRLCSFAIAPKSLSTHLRDLHRRLTQEQRRQICEYVKDLSEDAQTKTQVICPHPSDHPVAGFPYYSNGLRCDWVKQDGQLCAYLCRSRQGIQTHCRTQHGWANPHKRGRQSILKPDQEIKQPWTSNVTCQTFFRQPDWLHYFQVTLPEGETTQGPSRDEAGDFFASQHLDIHQTQEETLEAANIVEGFDRHRSTVVPWLQATGIAQHVQGLRKDQIHTAVSLPGEGEDPVLHIIVESMQGILKTAHSWCFDGPDCMLSRPSQFALSRFQGPSGDTSGKQRVFAPSKSPRSLKSYFAIALRLLAYLYRLTQEQRRHFDVEEEYRAPEAIVQLTAGQQRAWQAVIESALERHNSLEHHERGDDEDDSSQSNRSERSIREQPPPSLEDRLINFWMLLVCHDIGARRYTSPLVSFCAMLSVQPTTGSWMKPGNYSSDLSKMIWVVQLIVFYDSARRERCGEGTTLASIRECCEVYLQQANETPMGEILRWRLLLFHVRDHTVGDQQAVWDDENDAVTYEGVTLRMDQIPTLLKKEHQRCRHILYKELMLGASGYRPLSAPSLQDRNNNDTVNWSFKDCADNAALLDGTEHFLLRTIERSKPLSRLFVSDITKGKDGRGWRESAMATYEAHVQDFLAALCVLIHISSGQPLREPEFFSMLWRNTQRRRHITLRFSRVMIQTNYGKQQEQQGLGQDSVRFLAQPIGTLLLDYIIYVLPLRERFLRHAVPHALSSPLLWEEGGRVWPETRLSASLEAACARARLPRLHVSNWRQITVAIVKTKFAGDTHCFEVEGGDPDEEEIVEDIRAMTNQRNHRTRTGLRASQLWHAFWGLDILFAECKRKNEPGMEPTMRKRIAKGIYKPRPPWSSGPLLQELRRLYRNPSMQWKSKEQERAVVMMMTWEEQIIAVLPTGGGKSILFMLPCTLSGAGVTLLVVPLVALRGDLLRRVQELKIDYLEWTPEEERDASLVFVSAEAASQPGFLQYARRLVDDQRLDRIVVDECHLTVTAADYRRSIVDLSQIRSLPTQFVYLTATLPPAMQTEFEERNHLHQPTIIRASTNRSNIFYTVQQCPSGPGRFLQQVATDVLESWPDLVSADRDKAVLYVRSRDDARDLAALLTCDLYVGGNSLTNAGKTVFLQEWTKDPQRPFLVATTALAEGFDYPYVRLAAIVDEPQDLMVFGQETGRIGRDGTKAYAVVYLPSTWKALPQPGHTPDLVSSLYDRSLWEQQNRLAVHRFLRGDQCRRTALSEALDDPQHRWWCMANEGLG